MLPEIVTAVTTALVPSRKAAVGPISPTSSNGWGLMVREPVSGAWQRNMERTQKNILTHTAVFSCVTLIASDIGKLVADGIGLVQKDAQGIWNETENSAYSAVLRKPNRYQNRIKFIENWVLSKNIHGNTYVLLERDNRGSAGEGNVRAMYVLDPQRVRPVVAPDGSVFYQIGSDNLAGVTSITVPASEVIHDIGYALYHPLCGVSPLIAAGLAAMHGLEIQEHSAKFFANQAKPGGILTAPGHIPQETADRLKKEFEGRYGADNIGRLMVAGDGLKFEAQSMTAVQGQLIEQLKWTAEQVCTVYHVPPFMIGAGPLPSYNNVQALTQMYYSQALQETIESLELALGEGLGLANDLAIRLDLEKLLQMDTDTRVRATTVAILGGLKKPNEGRKEFNLRPVEGGDQVYLQQQNFSLAALNKRDQKEDPFSTSTPEPANDPGDEGGQDEGDEPEEDETDKFITALNTKFAGATLHA